MMTHWRSTNVKHFVQALTPIEADGDGTSGGYIESSDGTTQPMYNLKQDNPPVEYHIDANGVDVTDWLVHEDGSISDLRTKSITDEDKVYIVDALIAGMLIEVKDATSEHTVEATGDE
jgi:hypothetical protein